MSADTLAVELDDEADRYHRQTLITWWDQQRLQEATVLVAGAGALGNELVKNLVLIGVGRIVLVDMDQVENSNLSRCVFFRASDEGREKAVVVAEAAGQLNPDAEVIPIVGDLRTSVGLGTFMEADVVLGGLDNREARLFLNQACWKTTTPWVDGAIEGLQGLVRAFVPPESACYESTMNAQDLRLLNARKACTLLSREELETGKVPTTATTSSVVAGIQVQEAVKLLHLDRLDYTFAGKGFVFNGLTHDSYTVSYSVREDALGRDTYELSAAPEFEGDAPLGELLELARGDLSAEPALDLELEIVLEMHCAACERAEPFRVPAVALAAEDARCPSCAAERAIDLVHTIDDSRPDVLELSWNDLGLSTHDVVTARAGLDRRHYLVGAEHSPLVRSAEVAR